MTSSVKEYHHGNLYAALLTEAEKLLPETGAAGLSLREVARRTGVSHGAPRRHFPDKQALLSALAENGYERLGAQLDAALDGAEGTFTERLTAFATAYVDFAVRHGALLDLMFTSKNWPDADHLLRANERAFAAPVQLLARARAVGEITDGDAERVDMAVLAVLQGLAVMAHAGLAGTRPMADVVSGTVTTLADGLRPRRS
ncbi:TetR/AcrR family transcriptional regulator [Streptomyces sp. NPDC088725]|uniref:TetR/AcrR family transcriptional regulator n=1 Tax=Streptomyces sp. NPDC088725 TaxID=3365873 RepID=UPI00380AFD80